jgi:acetate kinase
VNEAVKKSINICSDIAPLHNPINLHSIELSEKLFPHAKHIAVFDTSFHQTIPVKNYLFALPKKYTKKYGIRKY